MEEQILKMLEEILKSITELNQKINSVLPTEDIEPAEPTIDSVISEQLNKLGENDG